MSYLVVYDLGAIKTAQCFDSYDESVDYINECSAVGDKITLAKDV